MLHIPGVEFRYKHGHKIMDDRAAKSRLLLDAKFADDAALNCTPFQRRFCYYGLVFCWHLK